MRLELHHQLRQAAGYSAPIAEHNMNVVSPLPVGNISSRLP